ncbi:UNVERIFIED_CONTAM: hypothetical protein PYX00_008713 [Menopon gallinae]|uniref:DET1 homolog n=1 Tax=Menopon gallinae TaxID=328185 RepID=A0AAW2HPD8_9NEOP
MSVMNEEQYATQSSQFDLNLLRKCLKPRKIPVQNVVIRLQRRETFGSNKGNQFHIARQFYQNVFPNFTVVNVEKPPCFLRKFSPDGKYFIAFSSDQSSLEIYRYQGCAAAGDLVNDCVGDHLSTHNNKSEVIRNQIFKRFFKLKRVITVAESIQQLNRECSLFSNCGRYVIIGSASNVAEDRPNFYEIYTNNEAVTPNSRSPLEDYKIYLIDLENGDLCDWRDFKVDKIILSHNQGLYLYKDTLAVLSVQHQTIHIFQISNGRLINVRKIGRNCFEDDDFVLSCGIPMGSGPNVHRPFREATINCLKHRLLVFLYKRAKAISDEQCNPYEIRKFYQYFHQLNALRMWKMQLLDHDHLLIKYASEDVVTLKATEPTHSHTSFFMIYNMKDAKVLAVYENTSEEFLHIFENFCDYFRNAKLYSESQFTCSPSNNTQARYIITAAIQTNDSECSKRWTNRGR